MKSIESERVQNLTRNGKIEIKHLPLHKFVAVEQSLLLRETYLIYDNINITE